METRELIKKYRALEARVDAFVRPTLRKQAETAAEMQAVLDELENDHGLYYVPDRRRTAPGCARLCTPGTTTAAPRGAARAGRMRR